MPNWCVNQVDIQGDEAEVAKLVAFVKSDDSAFTFENIVPPPATPMYSSDASHNKYVCGCESVAQPDPENEGRYIWVIDGKKVEYSGKCPTHNEHSFSNHPDNWYNWNIANWGTKWSASEVWHDRTDDSTSKVDGTTNYGFDTAWSPAEPVVAALAEKFPTLRIIHRYCEGGMGYAGEVVYLNGEEARREEYDSGEAFPDEAWHKDEDGSNTYERDYDKVPMSSFERFCEEHFGGVVGG